MKFLRQLVLLIIGILIFTFPLNGQSIDVNKLRKIRLKTYLAGGLMWKGESTQNTNWNKICVSPDGKIWFCGGDHWGTEEITGHWRMGDRYDRLYGFGNTAVNTYDPKTDGTKVEFELDKISSLYSNVESPGHGKIHAGILSDSKGNIYTAGYLGSSFIHEYTQAYFPKSYVGSALIKYEPSTGDYDYYNIPCPGGGIVALCYDEKRNIMNGISVDRAKFWRINLSTMELNIYESIARMSRIQDRVREMIMDNDGYCYFANDVGGLTKFDPDTEIFTDIDLVLPGRYMDFRASAVSSKNIVYCITTDGFVFSFDPKTNKIEDYGHIVGRPDVIFYTPNIALDEELGRLYFLAGSHGTGDNELVKAWGTLTVLDIKTKKYYWVGVVDGNEGCFGSVVGKDHNVYFSSFGYEYDDNGEIVNNKRGEPWTRPFLLKYEPPKNLNTLE
ncbi:hypothetical protein KAS50_08140 [bacterium]|nr:hypothetical protein [bacterium]